MLERKSFVKLKLFIDFKNTRVIWKIEYDSLNFFSTSVNFWRPTKLSEWVNVSKNDLNVFAILLFSVKNPLFSFNVMFDSPSESLFEKYGLQFFQNGFESF